MQGFNLPSYEVDLTARDDALPRYDSFAGQ